MVSPDTPRALGSRYDRRRFLAAGGSAAALVLSSPRTALAADANGKIRVGFVGCGGRGSFVAKIFQEDGGFEITAAADYFQDKADTFGEKFGVAADARFIGLEAIDAMLASDLVDAVAIHTPSYFHPEQVAKSVDAGKHVLVAKPLAVDVPGVRTVEASAAKAKEAGLSVIVDVQCRGDAIFQEAAKRVQEGGIGDFCYGICRYEYGAIGPQAEGDDPESRLRNWVLDTALSGDIIVEQNIHALDIFPWALGAPVAATGTAGRKSRGGPGDTSDHYALSFAYEGGGIMHFLSRQYQAWGSPGHISNEIFGSAGALFATFGGKVYIRGEKDHFWRGGETPDLYKSGSVNNVAAFRKAILSGNSDISTVTDASESTLVAILGREVGRSQTEGTWADILIDQTTLKADLEGLS